MKKFSRLNNITGWVVFLIASIVYLMTIEPTASWWDCGEYISTSYKLQVGHPPGAPLFQMIGRFFSLFAFGDVSHVARMVNIMSALASGFTILFLFWSITLLARKIVGTGSEMTRGQMFTILAAGVIGSLAYTFTDSFWFSAEEGEVYAMSSFFTAVTFWAILKWESVADEKHNLRWIIFIAYLMGLAIGVHLLNLLVIPAICFVYYFKKFKTTRWGILVTMVISILILAFIMYIIIPWVVDLSARFELLFVNGFGLPFNTGTIVYFILLTGLLVWGIYYTRKKSYSVMNTALLAVSFLLIGYTSFLMLVIRANAGTPINENAPKDAISLLSYLNREQYGDWPLLYGQYYSAPIVDYGDGKPVYKKDTVAKKYVIIDARKGTKSIYDKRFMTIFPREWSNQRKGSAEFYKNWGGPGVNVTVTDPDGKPETLIKPTFGENLKYFFSYQVGYMYIRYFLWNYSGRQNDVQGYGGSQDGNWITGIPFLDKMRLGHSQTDLPDSMKNRGTNKYYMLPLILGLIGFFFHVKKDYKGSIIVGLLFLMTGVAIVIYLNQQPFEPRERDYAYAGSTYAFAMWIGIGVIYLIGLLNKLLKKELLSIGIVTLLTLILVPGIMAEQNWNDHDRSGKYACRDFAANYLNTAGKSGIILTNGDNDTFPLWYDQEVEGIRTDTRVVNLMLASGSWYINQMYKKTYDSDPIPLILSPEDYQEGTNDIIPYYDTGYDGYVELKDLLQFIHSKDPQTFLTLSNGEKMKFFPSKKIKITVDSAACVRNGIVPKYLRKQMVDSICWTIKSNQLYKNDLMMLDLIAGCAWKRPIYFASPGSVNHCFAVDSFCLVQGWEYQFMPVKAAKEDYIPGMGGVDPLTSYNFFMNKCKFGNLNDPHVYVDPESLSNSVRAKTNMLRTAQSLNRIGMKSKAVEIMDKYFNYFPESQFPFDMFVLPYAEEYYKAGRPDKANPLMDRLITIFDQNLNYYYSYASNYREEFKDDIETNLGMLRRISMVAKDYHQDALEKKAEEIFNRQLKKY